MPTDLPLYWFQKESKARVIDAWDKGKTSVMISLPTGSGKTIAFSSLLQDLTENSNRRGLILVHRDSLLEQSIDKLNFVWPGVQTGKVKGRTKEYNKQITVGSIQTLTGCVQEFIESTKRYGDIDYVIIDEAHHSFAPTWRSVYDTLRSTGKTKFLGVTATPIRTKKEENLAEIFEDVVFTISIFQLIQEGFLSPLIGYNVQTSLSLDGVRITKGDYNLKDLSGRVNNSNFNRQVVAVWKEKAKDRKSICFAVDIDHVETLVEHFNSVGATAVGIHGKLSVAEQRNIIQGFADGKYNVLVNCQLLTEGFDEPSIDCVLMARPTSSRALYVQIVGRGLRLYPGKKNCLLIDFTSNSQDNAMITMQDLLGFYGLNRAEEIYKKSSTSELALSESGPVPFEISPESIPSLMAVDTFGEEMFTSPAYQEIDVFDMNKFAWTELDGDYFVTARQYLAIGVHKDDRSGKYAPYLIFSNRDDRCIAKISDPVDKGSAIAMANVYLFDYGNRKLMTQEQAWRSEKPSPEQIKTLEKAIANLKRWNPNTRTDIHKLPRTKGAYSDALTAIFSIGYINSSSISVISRDAATERLKRMVLGEMRKTVVNGQEQIKPPAITMPSLNNIQLNLTGAFTLDDHNNMVEIAINLSKDKYADLLVKFILLNQIIFEGDTVMVKQTSYPHYPLKDKQRGIIEDRVTAVFRLYYRNKKFLISSAN